jgi:hypothetical protein
MQVFRPFVVLDVLLSLVDGHALVHHHHWDTLGDESIPRHVKF